MRMAKKSAKKVTDGIVGAANSGIQSLLGNSCSNLLPSVSLILLTTYFFFLQWFMVGFDCLTNLFSSHEDDNPSDEEAIDPYAPSAPTLEQL